MEVKILCYDRAKKKIRTLDLPQIRDNKDQGFAIMIDGNLIYDRDYWPEALTFKDGDRIYAFKDPAGVDPKSKLRIITRGE